MELNMNIEIGNLIYQGKAKGVYETNDPQKVVVEFRDDITAGDGAKKDNINGKGFWNSIISAKFFEVLEEAEIKNPISEVIDFKSVLKKYIRGFNSGNAAAADETKPAETVVDKVPENFQRDSNDDKFKNNLEKLKHITNSMNDRRG